MTEIGPAENSTAFILPKGCAPYIALQRTQYQSSLGAFMRGIRLGRLYDAWLLDYVEEFRAGAIAEKYKADLTEEARELRDFLPAKCESWIDIGCGMAGIDVLMHRHYRGTPQLALLDKDGRSDIFYEFESKAAHYNSLELAKRFLELNGVLATHVSTYEVEKDGFPSHREFDLALSLISWGFHYPVDTYIAPISSCLRPGGRVIIDIRQGTGGELVLENAGFKLIGQVRRTPKLRRLVYEK